MIDPSIALQVRAPQVDRHDPLGSLGRVMSLRQLAQQGQMQEQRLKAAELANQAGELEMQDHEIVRTVLGETRGNLKAALPQLAGRISPKTLIDLQKSDLDARNTLAQIEDRELAGRKYQNQQLAGLTARALALPEDVYASRYPAIRAMAQQIRPDLELPEQPIPQAQLEIFRLGFMTDESYFKEEEERRKAAAEAHTAALRPHEVSKAEADAQAAQQTASGTQPITPYQQAQLQQPTGDLREFKQVFLPGYYQQHGIANPTAADELKAYKEFKQGQRVPVPGVDVPLPEAVEAQRKRITASRGVGTHKPPTQGERLTLGFYLRAADATKSLDEFEGIMAQKNLAGQARYQYAPNWMQSEENQQYRQAQRQFTEARLRRDSGAAIPDSEFENDAKMYFPQPGDTAPTLERKRRARQQVLRALRIGSGNAIREIGEEPGDMPASGSAPAANGAGRPPLSSFER